MLLVVNLLVRIRVCSFDRFQVLPRLRLASHSSVQAHGRVRQMPRPVAEATHLYHIASPEHSVGDGS